MFMGACFPINFQRLTDPPERTLVYGQFKQKTCFLTCLSMLFQLKISLRPQPNVYQQFQTPTNLLEKNLDPFTYASPSPPCHN